MAFSYTALTPVLSDLPQRLQNEMYTSLNWANAQFPKMQEIFDKAGNSIGDRATSFGNWATEDRQRWKDVYQPLQDKIISDANNWDSVENRQAVRGAATASVAQQMDAADAAAGRELERYGAKPTDVKYAALNRGARLARATAGAGASDVADRARQAEGVGLRMAAQGMGAGLPAQALAEGQAAQQGDAAAVTAKATPTNMFMGALGNPQGWGGLLNNANANYTGGVSATNSGNRALEEQSARNAGGGLGPILGMVGGLGTSLLAAPATGGGSLFSKFLGFEDGGEVPPGTRATDGGYVDPSLSPSGGAEVDDVAAHGPTGELRLNGGEFVMPQRATQYYGTKFFEGLIQKADKAMGIEPQPIGPEVGPAGNEEFARGGFTRFRQSQVPPPRRNHMRATDPRRAA